MPGRPAEPAPPGAAAEAGWAEFERRALRARPDLEAQGYRIACRAGCAACCHSMVSVTPEEAFAIAAYIEALPAAGAELIDRIVAHNGAHGGLGGGARVSARIACPCLDPETRLCRIHPARPLTCRGMNSVDAAACDAALDAGDAAAGVPTVVAYHRIVQSIYDRLGQDLADKGLAPYSLELTGALAAIWRTPDAHGRWRAGEDVFAGCRAAALTDAPIPRLA